MNIIIAGSGKVGFTLAEQLVKEEHDVTIVDTDEEALRRGVKVTGATVHLVNEIPDGGRILLQKAVEVLPDDTPETLQKRVMEQAEWKILPRAIDDIANGRVTIKDGKVRRSR